jgi:peroxiredoxin
MLQLQPMIGQWKDKGLETVVVTTDSRASIDDFFSKHPIDLTVLFDDKGEAGQAYQVMATPTGFLANRQGILKYNSVGWTEGKLPELQAEIDQALSE